MKIHTKLNDDLPCGTLYDGTWVDYNLQTTGCFSIGESNFSDHGANRLGASALMQGLAMVLYTIGDYHQT
jgi:hypothetical protein